MEAECSAQCWWHLNLRTIFYWYFNWNPSDWCSNSRPIHIWTFKRTDCRTFYGVWPRRVHWRAHIRRWATFRSRNTSKEVLWHRSRWCNWFWTIPSGRLNWFVNTPGKNWGIILSLHRSVPRCIKRLHRCDQWLQLDRKGSEGIGWFLDLFVQNNFVPLLGRWIHLWVLFRKRIVRC